MKTNCGAKLEKSTWIGIILNVLTVGIFGTIAAIGLMISEIREGDLAISIPRYVLMNTLGIILNLVTIGLYSAICLIVLKERRIWMVYDAAYLKEEEA